MVTTIFLYSFIPVICMVVGGIIASIHRPGPTLTSATQHFAAGVVFAAVALELLPNIGEQTPALVLVIGFMAGILSMLAIKHFSESASGAGSYSRSMVFAVGIDVFIDGLLIGIAFLVGQQGGILIAVALALEVLFLGLSTNASLNKNGVGLRYSLLIITLLALLIPFGSTIGAALLTLLPLVYTKGILSFGVAALLYLVIEELMVEAHEVEDTKWVTVSFFVGFLVILLLERWTS